MGQISPETKWIKSDLLEKMVSQHEWKAGRAILTEKGIYFTKPDENIIRDMIPLDEVMDVTLRFEKQASTDSISSLNGAGSGNSYIFIVKTEPNGMNLGHVYSFRLPSKEACQSWVVALRSSVQLAQERRKSRPSLLKRTQHSLRRYILSLFHPITQPLYVVAPHLLCPSHRRVYRGTPFQCGVAALILGRSSRLRPACAPASARLPQDDL